MKPGDVVMIVGRVLLDEIHEILQVIMNSPDEKKKEKVGDPHEEEIKSSQGHNPGDGLP